MNIRFTAHARNVLSEREIPEEWVRRVISLPEKTEFPETGVTHYLARLPENDNRWLRVVTKRSEDDIVVITTFFDRGVTRREKKR